MKRNGSMPLALLLAVLLAVSLLPLCGVTARAEEDNCYLNYYLDADAEYPIGSQEVARGSAPVRPEDPNREDEGKTFLGWYADRDMTIPYDFSRPLDTDTDMYARFADTASVVGVCFFLGPDEDYPFADQILTKGELVRKPADPSNGDLLFAGWYSDRGLENAYDFSRPVEDYLNLFARFVSEDDCYTVWLYLGADDQEYVAGFSVPKGDPCPAPEAPGKEGYVFSGWYTDRALTSPLDPAAPRSEDVSLFPKWTKDSADQPNPFLDVQESDYFYDAVLWAFYADPQVTKGVDETHFGPDKTVTRGQCVTFLWRAMGEPEPTAARNPFADVDPADYWYKAILWAVEKGITVGTDATHFSPAKTLSTHHIVTFLYRTLNPGMGGPNGGWDGEAEAWARDSDPKGSKLPFGVNIAVSDSTPCPRADVVTFLHRAAK